MTARITTLIRNFLGRVPPEVHRYNVTITPFGAGYGYDVFEGKNRVRQGWSYGAKSGAEFDAALAIRDLVAPPRIQP